MRLQAEWVLAAFLAAGATGACAESETGTLPLELLEYLGEFDEYESEWEEEWGATDGERAPETAGENASDD